MSETLEYIDAYFNAALNAEERKQFESRCSADEEFAKDVAFYVMAREEARQALIRQKQQWKEEGAMLVKLDKKPILLRWIPYAAAACLILVMAFYFLFAMNSPKRLASDYIKNNYSQLSNTMDASRDSLQLGIWEYKKKNYERAAALFESVKNKDAANSDAKKYAGLAYLQLKSYDKALQCFRELSAMRGLYSNSGDILQATTLLQRDATGDKETAKALLEKVVQQNEDGSDVAKKMLGKW